jgi:hypothetical protein
MILTMTEDFHSVDEEELITAEEQLRVEADYEARQVVQRENQEESECAFTSSSESYGVSSPENLMLVIFCH